MRRNSEDRRRTNLPTLTTPTFRVRIHFRTQARVTRNSLANSSTVRSGSLPGAALWPPWGFGSLPRGCGAACGAGITLRQLGEAVSLASRSPFRAAGASTVESVNLIW